MGNFPRNALASALLFAFVLAARTSMADLIASPGYAAEWGRVTFSGAPEAGLSRIEQFVETSYPRAAAGVRIVGPREFLRVGGLSALAYGRGVGRWLVLVPLGRGDRLFWAALVPRGEGFVVRYGMWYASRRARLGAKAHMLADRVLPERWRSEETRMLHAFEESGCAQYGRPHAWAVSERPEK